MDRPNINVTVGGPIKATNYTYNTIVLKPNVGFAEQIGNESTKYVVKWDFNLNEERVEIPINCIIAFDGGSLKNGTVVCSDTIIEGHIEGNAVFSGTYKNMTAEYLQKEIDDINEGVGSDDEEGTVKGRIKGLEEQVGEGTVDERIDTAKEEIKGEVSEDYDSLSKIESKIKEEAEAREEEDNSINDKIGNEENPNTILGRIKSIENNIDDLNTDVQQEASESNGNLELSIREVKGKITEISGRIPSETYDPYGAAYAVKEELVGDASVDYNTLRKAELRIKDEVSARQESIVSESSRAQAEEANLRALYQALSQSQIILVASEDWPLSELQENVIYRVQGTTSYSDYIYNGTTTIKMAEYDNATDDEPVYGSNNIPKSGGVAKAIGNSMRMLTVDSLYNVNYKDESWTTGHNIIPCFGKFCYFYLIYHYDSSIVAKVIKSDDSAVEYSVSDIAELPNFKGSYASHILQGTLYYDDDWRFIYFYTIPSNQVSNQWYIDNKQNIKILFNLPDKKNYVPVNNVAPYLVLGNINAYAGTYTSGVILTNRTIVKNTNYHVTINKAECSGFIVPLASLYKNDGTPILKFYDSENNELYDEGIYQTKLTNDIYVTFPDKASYAIVNVTGQSGIQVVTKNTDLESRIAGIIQMYDNSSYKEDPVQLNITNGYCIVSANGNFNESETYYSNGSASEDYIPVKPGEVYAITAKVTSFGGTAGYNKNKQISSNIWSTAAASLYRQEKGVDYEITIPDNVYYIRVSTSDNDNYPISVKRKYSFEEQLREAREAYKNIPFSPMLFKVISSSLVEIWSLNSATNKYIVHPIEHLTYSYDMSEYGGSSNLLCEDVWNPDNIRTEDGETLLQGNLNFIYKVEPNEGFENEDLHVGPGHGLEVLEYTKIFVDGTEIDLSNLHVGDVIPCSRVRLISKTNCYAPDKSISSLNENNYPKIVNGEPVLTASHYMNAVYETDNVIRWRNRLVFKRDGIKFSQLHGGMVRSFTNKLRYLITNDAKSSLDTWGKDENDNLYCIGIGDSYSYNHNKYKGDEVTMYGGDISVKQRMIQDDGIRTNKSYLYGVIYSINSMKMYFMPADVSQEWGTAETFNTGDEISVTNERKIEYRG